MVLVTFVNPDPKEIGMNLQRYYPDYVPPARSAGVAATFNSWGLLRDVRTRLAILSNCAGQGNMAIVMVLTSLVLSLMSSGVGQAPRSLIQEEARTSPATVPPAAPGQAPGVAPATPPPASNPAPAPGSSGP